MRSLGRQEPGPRHLAVFAVQRGASQLATRKSRRFSLCRRQIDSETRRKDDEIRGRGGGGGEGGGNDTTHIKCGLDNDERTAEAGEFREW